MNWGERVKYLREQKGMTQADLAKKSGISRSYIAHIETGRYKSYRGNTLEKLSRALNLPSSVLIGESEHGPTIFGVENISESNQDFLIKLAAYVNIAIGQGGSYHYGLFGPLPVPERRDIVAIVYSFSIKDPNLKDKRLRGLNFAMFAFLMSTEVLNFFYDRDLLHQVFTDSLHEVNKMDEIGINNLSMLRHNILEKCVPNWAVEE